MSGTRQTSPGRRTSPSQAMTAQSRHVPGPPDRSKSGIQLRIMQTSGVGVLAVVVVSLSALRSDEIPTRAVPPPSPHATKGVTYEDVTAASGVADFRYRAGEPLKPFLPET